MEEWFVTESVRMWVEILFNLTYLLVVWGFVFAMARRQSSLLPAVRSYALLFAWAFGLLALGDTGHVGFRVWAYARGGLDTTITFLGVRLGLVGLGALSTSITVTLFYLLMLWIWKRRFGKPLGWLGVGLVAAAAVRLVVMAFPQNQWNSSVPPWTWSMIRNVPLMIQGLGVAYRILRDARATGDRVFRRVGQMILVSYGFYIPVVLLVQRAPMLGMLMIPKTLAYVAIAWLAYANLYLHPSPELAAVG
jgi:hypothetical protein